MTELTPEQALALQARLQAFGERLQDLEGLALQADIKQAEIDELERQIATQGRQDDSA